MILKTFERRVRLTVFTPTQQTVTTSPLTSVLLLQHLPSGETSAWDFSSVRQNRLNKEKVQGGILSWWCQTLRVTVWSCQWTDCEAVNRVETSLPVSLLQPLCQHSYCCSLQTLRHRDMKIRSRLKADFSFTHPEVCQCVSFLFFGCQCKSNAEQTPERSPVDTPDLCVCAVDGVWLCRWCSVSFWSARP